MDVSVRYKVRMDTRRALERIKPKVMGLVESAVKDVVNEYIKELENHLGTIPGAADYTDADVSWKKLDLEADEASRKFWYKTGGVARSVVVNMRVSDTGIRLFAGVPKDSTHYDKALWNELGFTPKDGDELIRRPVFVPLAEEHVDELLRRLRELTKNIRLQVMVT